MERVRKNIKLVLLLIFIVICFAFLLMKTTIGAYESTVGVIAASNMAGWSILINNTDVTVNNPDGIDLNYTITANGGGKHSKAAPGSVLEYPIVIDTTGTDVAVRFDLEIIDKSIDPDKFLELKEVSSQDITIVQTSASTYTGVITKSRLNEDTELKLKLEWPDDGSLIEYIEDTTDEDYFTINFHAIQYRGETIIPYE